MTTFTSTDPTVIAALREGKAKVKDAAERAQTWSKEIGAENTFGRSGWWGLIITSVLFPKGCRPDEDWTVPNRKFGTVRPKKTTGRGRELLDTMDSFGVSVKVPGLGGSHVMLTDSSGQMFFGTGAAWERDDVAWFDTADLTLEERDTPDPAFWTPAKRSQYMAAVEAREESLAAQEAAQEKVTAAS